MSHVHKITAYYFSRNRNLHQFSTPSIIMASLNYEGNTFFHILRHFSNQFTLIRDRYYYYIQGFIIYKAPVEADDANKGRNTRDHENKGCRGRGPHVQGVYCIQDTSSIWAEKGGIRSRSWHQNNYRRGVRDLEEKNFIMGKAPLITSSNNRTLMLYRTITNTKERCEHSKHFYTNTSQKYAFSGDESSKVPRGWL